MIPRIGYALLIFTAETDHYWRFISFSMKLWNKEIEILPLSPGSSNQTWNISPHQHIWTIFGLPSVQSVHVLPATKTSNFRSEMLSIPTWESCSQRAHDESWWILGLCRFHSCILYTILDSSLSFIVLFSYSVKNVWNQNKYYVWFLGLLNVFDRQVTTSGTPVDASSGLSVGVPWVR